MDKVFSCIVDKNGDRIYFNRESKKVVFIVDKDNNIKIKGERIGRV